MDDFDEQRLEAAERAAWRDIVEGAPPAVGRRLGLEVDEVAGATVLRAPGLDHVLFNRAIGLGVGAPVTEEALGQIAEGYARAGVQRYLLQAPERVITADVRRWLERRDLTPFHRAWVKLARGAEPPGRSRTDLSVVRADPRRRIEIARIVVEGFDLPEEATEVMASIVGRDGWHVYCAMDGERIAGVGGMFVRGSTANIAFAATRPEHRGRGAQGALVARRIQCALDLGCTSMTSETGEQVEGDPQHSYRNMVRHGLRPMYRRENWCPPGTTWSRAVA